MILRAALMASIATGACLAVADDAYVGLAGAPMRLSHSRQIQMESERVQIHLEDGASHFRAEFHFVNHGPATTVQMGFPDEAWNDRSYPMPISKIRSWVDGKEVKLTAGPIRRMPDRETIRFRRYWVKQVSFPSRGSRNVIVDYDAANSGSPDGESTEYILTTGATWSGPITDCTVSVDWEDLPSDPFISSRDGSFTIRPASPQYHVFHWKNLRPKADISIDWEGFDSFFLNGKRILLATACGMTRGYLAGDDTDDPDLMCACLINLNPSAENLSNEAWLRRAARSPYVIRGRQVSFPDDRHIKVGRHITALSRPLKEDESDDPNDWDTPFVRLRDVIHALGWTWRYDKATDRVFISTHPGRKR